MPHKLTIEGKGALLPESRRITYAPVAGIVVDVAVEHGQRVKKGDLLVRLDSRELEKEPRETRTPAMQGAKRWTQANYLKIQVNKAVNTGNDEERNQLQGQLSEAQIKAKSSQDQIDIIDEQLESMKITAPLDGIVTTWEASGRRTRSVALGRGRHRSSISVAATSGEWVPRSRGPRRRHGADPLRPRAGWRRKSRRARRSRATHCRRTSSWPPTPSTAIRADVRRIASKAELVDK